MNSLEKLERIKIIFRDIIDVISDVSFTQREKEIFFAVMLDNSTYEKVAQKHGLSNERVRQIVQRSLRKLTHKIPKDIKYILANHEHLTERKNSFIEENRLLRKIVCTLHLKQKVGFAKDDEDIIKDVIKALLLTPVSNDDLSLSVRTVNSLSADGIKTLYDLVQYSRNDLMKFRNFGVKSLSEIEDVLESFGLSLGMDTLKYFSPQS